MSRERKFALENGGKYLVNVGDRADFHWLVNVRLNALKVRVCGGLNVDHCRILNIYESSPFDDLYWSIFQHYNILGYMGYRLTSSDPNYKRDSYLMYLGALANAHFDLKKKNFSSQSTARDILVEENEMSLEDVGNVKNSNYEFFSNACLQNFFEDLSCSPDKKLVAITLGDPGGIVKVFELPSLTMIFEVSFGRILLHPVVFSPDSSYFLCGSIRSCGCIRKQKEVAFIPGGPEDIKHCSFSSCGKKLVTAEENFLKVWNVEKRELLVQVEERSNRLDRYYFSSCNNYILQLLPPFLVVCDSATLEKIDYACSRKCLEECLEECLDSQIMYFVSGCARVTSHYHLSSALAVVDTPVEPFTWKNRRCQILSRSSTLIIYDLINHEVIDRFHIDCFPSGIDISFTSKLDGTNFLFSLDSTDIVVLSLETPEESSVVSSVFPNSRRLVTLSPDHLYVACYYYEYSVLTIKRVDNGETLETVELKKPPKACWWSELCLWMFCEGTIVRFPYYPTHLKVLGSGLEIHPLRFVRVLGFGEGVFVYGESDNMITILKICDNMPFIRKIGAVPFSEAAISKDGCSVLLYDTTEDDKTCFQYQVWECTPESGWELHLDGIIRTKFREIDVKWLSLTGTQNCRRLMCVGYDIRAKSFPLFFFEFTSTVLYQYSVNLTPAIQPQFQVLDVTPNFLLIATEMFFNVFNVPDNKIIATSCFCGDDDRGLSDIFYLSSKGLLIVVLEGVIKCFKIHNIGNE